MFCSILNALVSLLWTGSKRLSRAEQKRSVPRQSLKRRRRSRQQAAQLSCTKCIKQYAKMFLDQAHNVRVRFHVRR